MHALTTWQWIALAWLAAGKLVTISFAELLGRAGPFRRRQIYALPPREGQRSAELRSAWLLLTDPIVLALLLSSGALALAPSRLGPSVRTFVILFVWTDLWMYFTHRAMHRFPWLWRIHLHHHLAKVPQPTTAMSFSLGEKLGFYTLGWLLPLAALSHALGVTLAGVVAFYSFYFVTSPFAHANYETTPPGRHLLGTATGHAMHHARMQGNYGFLTSIPDRLFGTFFADTADVHRRVSSGGPLARLGQRITEPNT